MIEQGKTNKLIAVVGKLYNNYLEKIIDMILINCSYGLRNRWNKLYEPELNSLYFLSRF